MGAGNRAWRALSTAAGDPVAGVNVGAGALTGQVTSVAAPPIRRAGGAG